jgi:cyclic beta-1,2-glucan synthetase
MYTSGRKTGRSLMADIQNIDRTAARAAAWNRKSRLLPQEIEWLLDNRYLCRREGEEARRALRNAKALPAETRTGLPAVYAMAADLVDINAEISEAGIFRFLTEKQTARPLSERELWLFTTMLRVALISKIAESCRDIDRILDAYAKTSGDSPFTAEARAFALRQAGRVPDRAVEEFAAAAESAHRRNAETIGTLISSLRFLSSADLTETLQNAGALDGILRRDPLFEQMDEETRGAYRRRLARLAKKTRMTETEAAEKVLSLCAVGTDDKTRHAGYYLWDRPLGRKPSKLPGVLYFTAFALMTFLPAAACAVLTERVWAGLLLVLPLAAMAKNITDAVVAKTVPCRPVPRLELADGLPEEGRTLCVVSALLTGGQKGAELAKKLEAYRLANRDAGENLLFGLLADLPDGTQKIKPVDARVLSVAQQAIFALNRQYGGGFYLFTRDREWNVRDKIYMAWERKRGALLELCRLLRGKSGGMRVVTGDKAALGEVRFLITLDSDTVLTPGSARRMTGSMLHPLNRPEVDPEKKTVTRGHGVLAPRMAVDLEAAGRSVFSRVFAGQGGLDPYSGAAGEVYHDLFGQGSFHGKGIFDVDVYLECLDGRLPENRILSHDLLEGGYLRAGLMEDVELTDGFPSTARAWFLRQHRWIRGDWQVAKWVFSRALTPLARWKLFDPIRGSITPIATLAALTAGTLLPGRAFGIILAVTLIASASHLLLSFAERAVKPGRAAGRTHAAIITGIPAVASQTFLNLAFLPHNAVLSLHAAVIALWRMCVSKRKLLQWKTSAEVENVFSGAVQTAREMFPALAWGVFTACLTRSAVGWTLGVLWAVSPFIAHAVSKSTREAEKLNGADRAFLLRQAALMWRYFEDFSRLEDNFLIPDNFQEQPAAGAANRTSPTNVGLGLLCALAAVDLGLCAKERALFIIAKTLDTLEKLPKWNGHILNWYDTRTLEPLPPRCVSSVDSGNLCGCLIALREGLLEWEDAEAEALSARAGALADGMDFRPLYDKKKKFFKIGIELDNPDAEMGVYDLLASEARQTSYIAVARGETDKKHWQRLGRAHTALGRYRGMASWTGTMFEYFMPHLLLPAYRDSLLRESLDFAVYAHRLQAAKRGGPWGISESCFYAFDRALNYQYKAHGVPALAYKRGLGADHVVSPYSSFLTLLTHPSASVKNLRRLHRMGAEGQYGLIEALDFTPGRNSSNQTHAQVMCYMSHHLGMSLIAVCNALRENVMQKRFMRDAAMGAFAGLLQERVPVGAAVIKPVGREVPDKLKRAEGMEYSMEIEKIRPGQPKMALLGNASYTVLCTDNGATRSQCGGEALTLFDPYTEKGGLRFFFGGLSLAVESASFTGTEAVWRGSYGNVNGEVSVLVPENENAELRVVTLQNRGSDTVDGNASAYFEPILQAVEDYTAHPAFSKLFLDARIEDGVCLIRRRPRSGSKERWLAFACDRDGVRYETSREKVIGRQQANFIPRPGVADAYGCNVTLPPPIDPCVYASAPVSVEPGEKITLRYALAAAATAADAISAAKRTLKRSEGSGVPDGAAQGLELTPSEREEAFEWLAGTVYRGTGLGRGENIPHLGKDGLWASGISGDLPLLVTEAFDNAQWERVSRVIRQHRWLKMCGFTCDLVVFLRDGGDYRRLGKTLLMEILKACRAEHTLGRKGGVHAVDLETLRPGQEALIKAFASVKVPIERGGNERLTVDDERLITDSVQRAEGVCDVLPVRTSWGANGAFSFEIRGELPPLAWSHTLANRNFSALVTETGAGYIAFQNARENKYTPWTNDPLAIDGGTVFTVNTKSVKLSPFAADDGIPCSVTYGFGYAEWKKRAEGVCVAATQFVPPDRNGLVTVIEVTDNTGASLPFELSVRTTPVMGVVPDDGRMCVVQTEDDGSVTIENPLNTLYAPQTFVIAASGAPVAERERLGRLTVSLAGQGSAVVIMGAARNERGIGLLREFTNLDYASSALERTKEYWAKAVKPAEVKSGSAALDRYGNGWALYQVIATRLYARAALYQCGGAYGFRDQLQDVCAALRSEPRHAKVQILRACSHQYEEGDVMHWWHPANKERGYSNKGVRTHCSDDLLWLPYVVAEYVERTGDKSLTALETPYLSSPVLETGKDDRYESAGVTNRRGSVYEHCMRAFECVMKRGVGEHGLLLMGTGDWNDGMNLVGHQGRGESVWLTWFAAHTAERFSSLCGGRGDDGDKLQTWAKDLVDAAAAAWDGEWFLRGYYDDGCTLGSKNDAECKIDSIAQSFSALFGNRVPKDKVKAALESAYVRLVDKDARMIKLFAPPFTGKDGKNPGYIKGYLPGVRENGGQYTHAAIWLAMAFLKTGDKARCLELLELLLPGTHDPEIYKAEPHVLAADVYGHAAHLGRGGWSHYTGAASWYYRVLTDALM